MRLRIVIESNVGDDRSRPQNLAGSATYSASSQWSKDRQFVPGSAFDDRFDTRWNSAAKDGVGACPCIGFLSLAEFSEFLSPYNIFVVQGENGAWEL